MEVKKGYKQTEVGVIPDDWEVKKLGDLLKVIGGGAFKSSDSRSSGIKWLKISNVGINRITWEDESYLPVELVKGNEKYILKADDYVIALTRPLLDRKLKMARLGKSDVPALLNQRVGKVQAASNMNIDFAYYLFQKFETINALIQSMAGTDPPNLGNWSIYNINCPVPPTLKEQSAIAAALSDTDALICGLEKLIAKKRNIKEGALQELLKPKKGWEVKRLGEIGESIIGLTYSPDNVRDSGLLVLRSSNVQEGILKYEDNVFVNIRVSDKLINRENDLLICVRNGSRNLIGKCALIQGRAIGETFGAFMAMYRSDYNRFIFHVFQSQIIKRQIDEHLGATINQITNKSLNAFEIPFPPLEQQKEIDRILSDMDAEINALQYKLSKYHQIKAGLMQNLLTGKIRLVS